MSCTPMHCAYSNIEQYLPIAIVCPKALRTSHNSNAHNRQCLLVMPVVVPRGSVHDPTQAQPESDELMTDVGITSFHSGVTCFALGMGIFIERVICETVVTNCYCS